MNKLSILLFLLFLPCTLICKDLQFYGPQNSKFQYTGRIDFSNPALPRFYAPGVYVKAAFSGTRCEVLLNDEELYGKNHNYVSVVIDDQPAKRIKLSSSKNVILAADSLEDKPHIILICKSTESGIGYLEFGGIRCAGLLSLPEMPVRRMEFIGNSITCGMGSDLSIPCNSAEWYDQHNAYMSYGPLTARTLNARWQLTAVSGIGLIHSCCDLKTTMPQVFDKINLRDNRQPWDFKNYQPDVLTVCLGQNDGKQDSLVFCKAYADFLRKLRSVYPRATIICLTSPMADPALRTMMENYLPAIVRSLNNGGDKNVYSYFFSRRYNQGCSDHPSLAEHADIASELAAYVKRIKNW